MTTALDVETTVVMTAVMTVGTIVGMTMVVAEKTMDARAADLPATTVETKVAKATLVVMTTTVGLPVEVATDGTITTTVLPKARLADTDATITMIVHLVVKAEMITMTVHPGVRATMTGPVVAKAAMTTTTVPQVAQAVTEVRKTDTALQESHTLDPSPGRILRPTTHPRPATMDHTARDSSQAVTTVATTLTTMRF